MDRDILNEVIEAEKQIQQCIEEEQARLNVWLEQVKKEAAESVARAEGQDGDEQDRAVEAAKLEAEAKAKQAVAEAEARAARFLALDDDALAKVLRDRLPRILRE